MLRFFEAPRVARLAPNRLVKRTWLRALLRTSFAGMPLSILISCGYGHAARYAALVSSTPGFTVRLVSSLPPDNVRAGATHGGSVLAEIGAEIELPAALAALRARSSFERFATALFPTAATFADLPDLAAQAAEALAGVAAAGAGAGGPCALRLHVHDGAAESGAQHALREALGAALEAADCAHVRLSPTGYESVLCVGVCVGDAGGVARGAISLCASRIANRFSAQRSRSMVIFCE